MEMNDLLAKHLMQAESFLRVILEVSFKLRGALTISKPVGAFLYTIVQDAPHLLGHISQIRALMRAEILEKEAEADEDK